MWFALMLALLATPEERSVDDLLAALSSPDYQTRRKAVLAVEGRTEAKLLDRLIEVARSDRNVNIRSFAATALGGCRDERIFAVLASMAKKEEYGARVAAYVGLGKLRDPRGRPILLAALRLGRGERGYAAKGLGLLGNPEDFQPVAQLLLRHVEDPYVADLAPAALVRLRRADGLALLRKHFVSFPPYARSAVARVLGASPDDATRAMMEMLLRSDDAGLRRAALGVLAGLADRKATPALLAHIARRPAERAAVFQALGRSRDPRALNTLVGALLVEREPLEKMRLIEALGRLGDKKALDVLRPLLGDETVLHQPRRISAVYGFPYSTRIDGAAAWAILLIKTGKEPFPLSDCSVFPHGQPPAHVKQRIADLRGK